MRSIPEVKAMFVNGQQVAGDQNPSQTPQAAISGALGCPLCLFAGIVAPLPISYMIHGTSYCLDHAKLKAKARNIDL